MHFCMAFIWVTIVLCVRCGGGGAIFTSPWKQKLIKRIRDLS